jgi:hypothetical protein
MITHVTHLVVLLLSSSTGRNPTESQPLPSVDDIKEIAECMLHEDAIWVARDEIACLDDMSLDGDLPDNISDNGDDREKGMFPES